MRHFVKLVRPYIVWAFIIIVVPILLIMLYSVTTGGNDLVNISFTWDNFKKIGEPIYLNVLKRSLVLGLISVAICFVFGYALTHNGKHFLGSHSNIVQQAGKKRNLF